MTASTDKPVPVPDRDSAPFWEGVRAGELRLQRCLHCHAWRWPARALCNRCHSFDADWVAVSGRGTVISWVRTHKPFMRAFQDEVPYVTILVRLDEQDDIQLIGRFGDARVVPQIGLRVRADFARADGGLPLIVWVPVG